MHRLCLISVFFVSDLFYDDLCYGIYGSPNILSYPIGGESYDRDLSRVFSGI